MLPQRHPKLPEHWGLLFLCCNFQSNCTLPDTPVKCHQMLDHINFWKPPTLQMSETPWCPSLAVHKSIAWAFTMRGNSILCGQGRGFCWQEWSKTIPCTWGVWPGCLGSQQLSSQSATRDSSPSILPRRAIHSGNCSFHSPYSLVLTIEINP